MKKYFLLISGFLLSFFLSAQDIKNYIPEQVNYIVKIDGERINKNVNFDIIRSSEMYKDFIFKMLNNKTAEQRAIIKLFETPDETGLNIKSQMYLYEIPQAVSKSAKASSYDDDYYESKVRSVTVVAIPLLNSKHFTNFIKDVYHDNSKIKVMKFAKGINFINVNNSTLIVWTAEKVFFCKLPYRSYYDKEYSKGDIKTFIKSIAFPIENKSILSNTKVLNALGKDSDISYIFTSNVWSEVPYMFNEINREQNIKDTTVFNKDMFKDNYSFSYINFENGEIIFTGNQFYGKKLASIIDPIFNLKPSARLGNILYQTPVTSYISYAFSLTEVQKFVDKTFTYSMDTLLIEYIRDSQDNLFDTDSIIHSYRIEIDSIDFLVNGPKETTAYELEMETITDSGTVYTDEDRDSYDYYSYDSDTDKAKYEHESLNWYEIDSLEARQDSLYLLIDDRKDTLAVKTYQSLGIKGDELWSVFNGEFLILYHAMTTVEKKSKEYEMDAEYNYVEVEKTKKIPMPLYSFALTINNNVLFKKYLNIMLQKGFIQKEKNRYLVVLGEMNQYIWASDTMCVITNDNNFNPSKRSATTKSDYELTNFNRITNHQSGAYIEVGKILASSVQFVEDKETAEVLEILAKYFDETIYYTTFDENTHMNTKTDVVFNDDKVNSLNSIYALFNEMYVHFTKK